MVGFVADCRSVPEIVKPRRSGAEIPQAAHRHAKLTIGYSAAFPTSIPCAAAELPDVRHHADADLRSGAEDQLPARLWCSSVPATSSSSSRSGARNDHGRGCAAGQFAPAISDVTFDLREFQKDIDGYNARLEGMINGR
jgi:hypothetical protein